MARIGHMRVPVRHRFMPAQMAVRSGRNLLTKVAVLPIIVGVCMLDFRVRGQIGKGVQDRGDVVRNVLGV